MDSRVCLLASLSFWLKQQAPDSMGHTLNKAKRKIGLRDAQLGGRGSSLSNVLATQVQVPELTWSTHVKSSQGVTGKAETAGSLELASQPVKQSQDW